MGCKSSKVVSAPEGSDTEEAAATPSSIETENTFDPLFHGSAPGNKLGESRHYERASSSSPPGGGEGHRLGEPRVESEIALAKELRGQLVRKARDACGMSMRVAKRLDSLGNIWQGALTGESWDGVRPFDRLAAALRRCHQVVANADGKEADSDELEKALRGVETAVDDMHRYVAFSHFKERAKDRERPVPFATIRHRGVASWWREAIGAKYRCNVYDFENSFCEAFESSVGDLLRDEGRSRRFRQRLDEDRDSVVEHAAANRLFPVGSRIRDCVDALDDEGRLFVTLPRENAPVIGRESDVSQLKEALLASHRLVLLSGSGKCGKSCVARLASRELLAEQRFAGAAWVDLNGLEREDAIVSRIAQGLQVELEGKDETSMFAAAVSKLSERPFLLVIDSCDAVVANGVLPAIVGRLLRKARSLRVLVGVGTDFPRREVADAGVVSVPLRRLSTQNVSDMIATTLDADMDMPEMASFAAGICQACVGEPAAIRACCAPVQRGLASEKEVIAAVKGRITDWMRGAGAAVAGAISLLPDEHRSVLSRLAVFPGDFDIRAAGEVLADYDAELRDRLSALEMFLQFDCQRERCRLPETVQAAAMEVGKKSAIAESRAAFCWYFGQELKRAFHTYQEKGGADVAVQIYEEERHNFDAMPEMARVSGSRHAVFSVADGLAMGERIVKLRNSSAWMCQQCKALLNTMEHEGRMVEMNEEEREVFRRLHISYMVALLEAGEYAAVEEELEQFSDEEIQNDALLLNLRGRLLHAQGDLDSAHESYAGGMERRRNSVDESSPPIAESWSNLGTVQGHQGNLEKAEEMLRESLHVYKESSSGNGLQYARACDNLGVVLHEQGKTREAAECFQESNATKRASLGEYHLDRCSSCISLAKVLVDENKFEDAERVYSEALNILAAAKGSANREYANVIDSMANISHTLGKRTEAVNMYRESIALWQQLEGNESRNCARACNKLAVALQETGKLREAERHLRTALDAWKKTDGLGTLQYGRCCNNLGEVLRGLGKLEEAEEFLREALASKRHKLGESSSETASACSNLARVLRDQNKLSEAESVYREAISIRQCNAKEDDLKCAALYNNLAATLKQALKYDEAAQSYLEVVAIRKNAQGEATQEYARACNNAASVLQRLERYTEAEQYYRKALEIREEIVGAFHLDYARTCNNLATVLSAQGKYDEAATMHRYVIQIRQHLLGPNHPDLAKSWTNLATVLRAQETSDRASEANRPAPAATSLSSSFFSKPEESP